MHKRVHTKQTGFTIVELLIVIVVIGILAAITIVAYNGMQDKAHLSAGRQDMATIQKALALYYATYQAYPDSANCTNTPGQTNYENNWCGWDQGRGNSFIPGLVPEFIAALPTLNPALPQRDSYLYQSGKPNGSGEGGTNQYQLIRYRNTGLAEAEKINNPDILIGGSGNYSGNEAWGFRSNPNTPWW